MNKEIVLVSHGELSKGMLHSLKMIVGENDSLMSLSMMPGQHYSEVTDRVREMAQQNQQTQFIVIADLFGGSVCNGCLPLTALENVKLISGLNMGMVIEFLFAPAPLTDEAIEEIIEKSKTGIKHVTPAMLTDDQDEDFF